MLLWDGYGLQSTHSGIGRHALELAQGLARLGNGPSILPSVPRLDPAFQPWTARMRPFTPGRIKPLALWAAGRQAQSFTGSQRGPHIFHGLSNYNIPTLPKSFQKVLTIHDLIPFLAPDAVSPALRIFMRYQLPRAIAAADRIICVSTWSAGSVEERFPDARGKITVIMNGKSALTAKRKSDQSDDKIRVFSVSRGESYKRLEMIRGIAASLPAHFEWHVLTQGSGLETLKVEPRLHLHSALSDQALAELWSKTDIFVHPSLWEGYCLPAAEALSRGIPTVFTGGSGIDEVVGSAGIRLEASEGVEAWRAALINLAQDLKPWPELCREQWGRLPSWQEASAQTQALYATLNA